MNNFRRALATALRNRGTLLGTVLASLLVGILWGANIGAVYPFVQVVFRGQSLHQWIDEQLASSETTIHQLEAEIAQLQASTATASERPEPAFDSSTTPDSQRADSQTTALISAASGRVVGQHAADRIAANDPLSARELDYLRTRLDAERKAQSGYQWLRPHIQRWAPADPFQTLLLVVAGLVVATTLKDTCLVIHLLLVERIVQLTMFDIRKQFFRRTLRLDLASFGEGRDSELLSRFTYDLIALGNGLNNVFGRMILEPLKMTACLAAACWISWRLLLFSLLITPFAFILMRLLARSIKQAGRRAMEEMSQLYNALSESFRGIQTVKAFTMEPFERSRFRQSAKKFYHQAMWIAFYNSLTKPVTELLGIGVISVALTAGAYLVLKQETHLLGIKMCDRPMEIGMLLLFYGMLVGVTDPARKLSEVLGVIQNGVAAADRVYQLMDREPTITNPTAPTRLGRPHRRLSLERVSFQYASGPPVLHEIDLDIDYGRTVALVGPNGCGKSSLVNLLPRFYDPTGGAIRLDGIDLRDLRLRDLRARIGLVTQQTHLFDDTVFNNIRYGTRHATEAQVVAAAKRAHAHRFIMEKLKEGYDTKVGQGGNRLSGGQRQRIALARAFLRDPEILILDEATSQIDIESEQLIHQALQEFVRGRTAIMITHRLSTLSLADEVVVMELGRMIDRGRHEELLGRCALYRKLHDIHFRQTA